MKQYGTAPTNYTAGSLCNFEMPMRLEALTGGSYRKVARDNRRAINANPVMWWREQVMGGGVMANRYHCGGYGK